MGYSLIAAPSVPFVTLAEVKQYLGFDDANFDLRLEPLRLAAVAQIEGWCGRSLSEQRWQLALDDFRDAIELDHGPVISLQSVQYYDADGALTTASPGLYTLDLVSNPQRVVLNSDASWPAVADRVNAVLIDFTAGYQVAVDDIKLAALLLVQDWFENGPGRAMPDNITALLSKHRRIVI